MSGFDARLEAEAVRARMRLSEALLAEGTAAGAWVGELSSSALATAVAISALVVCDPGAHANAVARGVSWLREHVNEDGGFGDSPESRSNLSTTTLCLAALRLVEGHSVCGVSQGAEAWVCGQIGELDGARLAAALRTSYGSDRTFSAPILAVTGFAGLLGAEPACWRLVPQLPFELAALPARLFAWLRLPVVSYALPALIAIGLLRHRRQASRNPLLRSLRDAATSLVLAKLERIQPKNGGFLEATPLTAFVTLSLAACGLHRSVVVKRSVSFLLARQRADGSWPIDTNLATWVTTGAVNALAASGLGLPDARRRRLSRWLLSQQHNTRHPFTQAAPGGFAWTDRPGGVPDADDTAGALVALRHLDPVGAGTRRAAERALEWLFALQNRDGGVPTFCRGWGRLPFDRSCPDITAHAVRAVDAWRQALRGSRARRARRFLARALAYLARVQEPDGSWLPLWFGSQWSRDKANRVYGTAQVVLALVEPSLHRGRLNSELARGREWLVRAQNDDGGWGRGQHGGSTVEETGLALAALAGVADEGALARGVSWLNRRVAAGQPPAAPIGLYFSTLWYSERLYPVLFALLGLGRVLAEVQSVRREGRVA